MAGPIGCVMEDLGAGARKVYPCPPMGTRAFQRGGNGLSGTGELGRWALRKFGCLILALVVLSGCARVAESRLNPFNWFGRGDAEVTVTRVEVIEDPRPLVAEVSGVSIDRVPGGAILRAVGLPPTQGYFAGALVAEAAGPGILSYTFRAVPPDEASRVSTVPSREVVVALFLSDQTLAGVRQIQVVGATNARAVRR
ncbi:MAG: hypothetical protein AAF771_14110 [Pseudomonadota bacterium]